MPNLIVQFPTVGQDPYGEQLLAALNAFVAAFNASLSSETPQPLGPVGAAGAVGALGSPAGHIHPHTGLATVADLENVVVTGGGTPPSRTVTAGTGLTGGGDLTADRTFAVDFGTTAGTVCEGDDARVDGAVQAVSTLGAATTALVRAKVTGDVTDRFAVRADGTISHGSPPVAISNVTGTTTVTVTTGANHGYGTGDEIVIDGVEGYVGANGTFTITRTGATTFTLDSTTGSGTYTTGGQAQRTLGGTGSTLEGEINFAADGTRDLVVFRGEPTGTGNLTLWRDHLGDPIAAMPQSGGFAVFGDDLRVFAGGDIFNSEVNLRADGTIRARKGDTGLGVGVFALGNVTTAPTANPDGTHTVNGATTVAGIVGYARDGRLRLRTAAGHEGEVPLGVNRRASSISAPGKDTTLVLEGALPPIVATADITASVDDQVAGPQVKYLTAAASGVDAGVVFPVGVVQPRWAPYLSGRLMTDASAVTNTRLAVGLVSAEISGNAGPASTGAYTVAAGAWLRYDTAVDTTAYWRAISADGTDATVTTTSVAIAADTSYELAIEINAAGTAVRFWVNDAPVATHTTHLPSASAELAPIARVRTLAASARALRLGGIEWSQKR